MTKHFIDISEFDESDLRNIFDFAKEIKNNPNKFIDKFKNKSLGMIFEKQSTRTRVSFDIGMKKMGGNTLELNENSIGFGTRESESDIIRVLSEYLDCLLIRNDIPYRWRARYNEDTDLSLRVLKDGWCTVQFNAFIQEKATTQTMKGGNEEIYKNGTLDKSKMLAKLHPDVAEVVWKFNRWHHKVDYKPFKKNKLKKKKGLKIKKGINNYGMKVVKI